MRIGTGIALSTAATIATATVAITAATAVAMTGTASAAAPLFGPPFGPGPVVTPGICLGVKSFPIRTQAPVLAQWSLILPLNDKGQPTGNTARELPTAQIDPPFLTAGQNGALNFYAPSIGATTTHSAHARTELVRRQGFRLTIGTENTMTATVAVTQVPADTHKIIVGQLHAAGGPFVTLRYSDGRINVIDNSSDCSLLNGVALGQKFSYQITQQGWELLYEASTTVNGKTVSQAVVTGLPAQFRDATAQFSAGDYEQAIAHAPTSAGRVTFYALETSTH
jgi:alginate lyase